MKANAKITNTIHKQFDVAFSGIGCLKGTILLQLKDGVKTNQALPRHVAYTVRAIQKGDAATTKAANHSTIRGG